MTGSSEYEDQIVDYVLGQLGEPERMRFEERMARDGAMAKRVAELEDRFQALDDTAEPEAVSDHLWSRIESGLINAEPVSAANSNTPRRAGLPHWAGMAAAIVVSLGVGFFGGQMAMPTPDAPLVVAVLVGDEMNPGAIVEAFADDSIRIVPLEALTAPDHSTLEMWTLPDEETGPVSLGTFQEARELILGGPDLPPPQPDQLYEITVEPEGGSPTGRPTGPILLKGFARAPVV